MLSIHIIMFIGYDNWMRFQLTSPDYGNKWLMIYNFGVCTVWRSNDEGWSYYPLIYVYNTPLKFKICNPNEDAINHYSHVGRDNASGAYITNFGYNIYSDSGVSSDDKKAFCIAIAIK